MPGFDMSNYVTVAERVTAFYDKYPDGSLQSEIVELTDSRVTVKAWAYRTPDDPRPGIGHSSLGIPGTTTFTRGSEVENAESSSWGRAIAALGFEVKRGIATSDEVGNKQPGQSESRPLPARSEHVARSGPAPARQRLAEAMARHNVSVAALERLSDSIGLERGKRATDEEIEDLIALIERPEPEPLPLPGLTEEEFEQVEAAVVPPRPGTDAYKRLPAFARSEARAYWAAEEVTA